MADKVAGSDTSSYARRGSPIGALILIVLGLIFLLNNFGIVSISVWLGFVKFWPLLLVLLGFQLIVGRSRAGSFLVFLLALLLVAAMLLLALRPQSHLSQQLLATNAPHAMTPSPAQVSVSQEGFSTASVRKLSVDNGIGKLVLNDAETDQLVQVAATGSGDVSPSVQQHEENGVVTIDVKTQKSGTFVAIGPVPEYTVSLGKPSLPTDVSVKSGTGAVKMDFTNLKLGELSLEQGAGSSSIRLSATSLPNKRGSIRVGAGSAAMSVPAGTAFKVTYEVGIGSVSVGSQTLRGSGTYTSPEFESAASKLELDLHVGAGSVSIGQ